MAKGKNKKGMLARAIDISNSHFKEIFKDIVENAKMNSDVDLKIVEPNLEQIVSEVKEALKEDREGMRLKKEEIKSVLKASFNTVKEAIRNDENNGLDDGIKNEWGDELDDFDFEAFLKNLEEDDSGDDDEEESFSNESVVGFDPYGKVNKIYEDDITSVLSFDQIKDAIYTSLYILALARDEKIIEFFSNDTKVSELADLVVFKLTSNKTDSPVSAKDEDRDILANFTDHSMKLVGKFMAVENDDEENISEDNIDDDIQIDVVDELPDSGDEVIDINKDIEDSIMTEERIENFEDELEDCEKYENILLGIMSRVTETGAIQIDLIIYLLYLICAHIGEASCDGRHLFGTIDSRLSPIVVNNPIIQDLIEIYKEAELDRKLVSEDEIHGDSTFKKDVFYVIKALTIMSVFILDELSKTEDPYELDKENRQIDAIKDTFLHIASKVNF